MTKLDITKIQGIIPKVLPEGNERAKVISNARKVLWQTLLEWEKENGSEYNFLSYQGTQDLEAAVMLGMHQCPEKFDDLVRVWWGEELPKHHDAKNAFVRIIMRHADTHYAEAYEVVTHGQIAGYERYRYENPQASHTDAMEYIRTAHFCSYKPTTSGSRNEILGTYDIMTVHACECGNSYETRSFNNYSGD